MVPYNHEYRAIIGPRVGTIVQAAADSRPIVCRMCDGVLAGTWFMTILSILGPLSVRGC